MNRKETLAALHELEMCLRDGGCTAQNSTELNTVVSAQALIASDRRDDRAEIAEKSFHFGLLFLSVGVIGIAMAIAFTLFGWSEAVTIGLFSAVAFCGGFALIYKAERLVD